MDKIVGIKRKAQRYVQSGDLPKAVAEYERLVESGEMDPYDYVYLGDLLVKISRGNDAVHRYRDAINAYERVGLYKNAIAVGKKILRIKPESFDIHRLVGGLYFLEGLYNDSLFYYMQFLSVAPPDSESSSIEEVGLRLLGMPMPSPDMALRIVDAMALANCAGAAARPLFQIALEFEMKGFAEAAEPLRRRAVALDPGVEQTVLADAVSEITDSDESSFEPLTFSGGDFGASGAILDSEGSSTSRGNGVAHPIEAEITHDFGMITLQNDDETYGAGIGMLEPDPIESPAVSYSGEAGTTDQAQTIDALLAEETDLDPSDFRSVVTRGEEYMAAGDTERALGVFLAAGRAAFNAGESRVAENVYVEIVKHDPNHLEALQGLTEIAHINGERAKIVRYGSELGDVLLARERYADAKLEFERVLQFDPRNEKAASRVRRLNSIDGMESVTARPLAPVASEVKGATVTVRKEPGRTQSMIDLSEIMSEFQTAVAGQVPVEDAQSHYDLGMTYLEMGMPEQAVDEFEIASRAASHRVRSLEMLARCLITSGRADEALAAVEEAAASGEDAIDRQASLFACRGLALEALGRLPEAMHALEHALSIDPELEMARDGIARLGGEGSEAAA